MYSKLAAAAFVVSQATLIVAHGGVTSYSIGSTTYPGWQPYIGQTTQATAERTYPSYDPITDPVSANMACNNNGGTGNPSQTSITISAGSDITAYWPQWTHREGPVTVYLAKCPGSTCDGVDDSKLSNWFKIQEVGLISGTLYTGTWGNGIVVDTLKWTTTIPASLQPGAYFIRHELLALHQANAPQFYPECAQLIITGSGTAYPSSEYLVSIPGAWTASDAGVDVNIYSEAAKTQTSYPVPGPPVWPGTGESTSSTTKASTTTTKASTSSSSSSTKTTTTSSASASSTAGTAAHYAQCGGIGWTGATVCASPYTCTKSSDYYSQCL